MGGKENTVMDMIADVLRLTLWKLYANKRSQDTHLNPHSESDGSWLALSIPTVQVTVQTSDAKLILYSRSNSIHESGCLLRDRNDVIRQEVMSLNRTTRNKNLSSHRVQS